MKFLTTPLEDIPWIRHGFFSRLGGQSHGIYGSLNCGLGSNDSPEIVNANRKAVAESIGISSGKLVTLYQVHSAKAVIAEETWAEGKSPEGDALVTDKPGLAIAILTADCTPVLFADRQKKIVGAAHAGWKGALSGVLESTIDQMVACGSKHEDITAAIGPCIGAKSYEVSDAFKNPFLVQDAANAQFFVPAQKPGHLIFNLPGYVAARLTKAGITEIHDTRRDTLTDENTYFSYRRTTLRGEKDYGRQASVIAIAAG
jgi:YfiH family protein